MDYKEFRAEMEDLEEQYKLEKKRILTEYVMSWCPYNESTGKSDICRRSADSIGRCKFQTFVSGRKL